MSFGEDVNPSELEREEDCCNVGPAVEEYLPKTIARVEPAAKDYAVTTTLGYRTVRSAYRKPQGLPDCLQHNAGGAAKDMGATVVNKNVDRSPGNLSTSYLQSRL